MEIKKVSEGFEEKCHEKYDPEQIREHWLEVDKIIKDCNNSIMEMGLPDIGYTSLVDPIHEYCDELINLNSYIHSAYGSVYEWLDYPLWLDFKNGVTEAISQIKAEEITTKNTMGIGGYSDTPLAKGYQWGAMPAKELTLSDFLNLMPDEAVENGFDIQGIQGMKALQELFLEEYEAKKKESPDLEDPRSYFEDMLVKGQEEHSDYHPFLDLLQTALDVAGFIPGIGEPADFVNAVLYAGRGDKINAALSASAAIPMIGNFAAGGKVVTKGKKVVKVAKKLKKGSAYSGDLMSTVDAARYSEHWRKLGIGSDETWDEFIKHNPNGIINDYFDIVQNQSPWREGFTPIEVELKLGDTFEMALGVGQPANTPGRFATSAGNITGVNYVRNDLAVKVDWKPEIDRVVTYQVKDGVAFPSLQGPVGPQIDLKTNTYLPGGANQINLLLDRNANAMDYLNITSITKIK